MLLKIFFFAIIITGFYSAIVHGQSDDSIKNSKVTKNHSGDEAVNTNIKELKFDKDMYLHAINGYDAVSYFADNKAEKGTADLTYNWMGAAWQFINKTHLEMFKKNPEEYAPQFGGFSAFGVADSTLIHTDGTVWTVENGKLYLDVNADYMQKFKDDLTKNIEKAEANWQRLSTTVK